MIYLTLFSLSFTSNCNLLTTNLTKTGVYWGIYSGAFQSNVTIALSSAEVCVMVSAGFEHRITLNLSSEFSKWPMVSVGDSDFSNCSLMPFHNRLDTVTAKKNTQNEINLWKSLNLSHVYIIVLVEVSNLQNKLDKLSLVVQLVLSVLLYYNHPICSDW